MADNKKLDSIVQIDGENYEVVAETAKKVANKLIINTIKNGITTKEAEFDGSKSTEITIEVGTGTGGGDADSAETANKIRVNMEDGSKPYATITISTQEPTNGSTGDIWFKY